MGENCFLCDHVTSARLNGKRFDFSVGLGFGIGLGLGYDSGYWLGLGFGLESGFGSEINRLQL